MRGRERGRGDHTCVATTTRQVLSIGSKQFIRAVMSAGGALTSTTTALLFLRSFTISRTSAVGGSDKTVSPFYHSQSVWGVH